MARRPGKKDLKSKTHTLDELSAHAGERWAREDAAKKVAEEEGFDGGPRKPRRARPRHGRRPMKHNPNLGGEHT